MRVPIRMSSFGSQRSRTGMWPARSATIDWWDDPYDVYRIHLRPGQSVSVAAAPRFAADISLVLWKPELTALADAADSLRAKRSIHPPGDIEHIHYRATAPGWYSLEVLL